jgi:hypothetical protein
VDRKVGMAGQLDDAPRVLGRARNLVAVELIA